MSKPISQPHAEDASSDRQFVTALARGLSILRCFDRPHAEFSVAELARNVGLSQPTVWRLCYTLMACGYLVRAPSGTGLRIGAPAVTLGYAATQGADELSLARPYLRQLMEETGGNTTLSVRQGTEMVALDQINGAFMVRSQAIGWRAPLDSVSSGLALLAALPGPDRLSTIAALAGTDAEKQARSARIAAAREALLSDGVVRFSHVKGWQYTAVSVPLFATDTAPATQWTMTCGNLTQWTEEDLHNASGRLVEIRKILAPAFAAIAARGAIN